MSAPSVLRSVFHGITDDICTRQADMEARQLALAGYVPISQSWAFEGSRRELAVVYALVAPQHSNGPAETWASRQVRALLVLILAAVTGIGVFLWSQQAPTLSIAEDAWCRT